MSDVLPEARATPARHSTQSCILPVTIALEGGGSFGAFAWGVLDRILDTPNLRIEAVSGASAGGMNAAMLVQGLAKGGPQQAKYLLEALWRRVAVAAGSPDLDLARWTPNLLNLFMAPVIDAVRRAALLNINLARSYRTHCAPCSTDYSMRPSSDGTDARRWWSSVRTGEARMFRDGEVTIDALLASACLPSRVPGRADRGRGVLGWWICQQSAASPADRSRCSARHHRHSQHAVGAA